MVTADLCWLTLLKWKRVAAIGLVLAAWATAAPPVVIMEPSGSELALVSREGARGWEPGDGWNEIKWIKWMQSWAAFCVYQFINMPKAGLYLEECIAHWEWINYYKSQRCPVVISRRGTAKIPTMSTTSTTTSTGFHSFGRSGEGPVGGSEVAAGWLRGGCGGGGGFFCWFSRSLIPKINLPNDHQLSIKMRRETVKQNLTIKTRKKRSWELHTDGGRWVEGRQGGKS